MRRHDIDWLRVIAILLLLFYHVAICFQPWGVMIGFVTSKEPWGSLWIPMTMLNIWRIPLLFFVSGMGTWFAMQNRTWQQLMEERTRRILIPLVVGWITLVQLATYLWRLHNGMRFSINFHPSHLWFLGNIFLYVILLSPLFYLLKRNSDAKFVVGLRKIFSQPLGLLIVVTALIAEVTIVKPYPYELYAMTWHGFILGLVAFLFGFCFVFAGDGFWTMIRRWRWAFVIVALALFLARTFYFKMATPNYLIPIESLSWILAVFAFCNIYLNRSSAVLSYLSKAVLPMYIAHTLVMNAGAILIFRSGMVVEVKFVALLLFTVAGCLAFYEAIRRLKWIAPLFGASGAK